uniref:Uncharacterized protein n=1 Tax=uncultured archaeon MedDCM-OCT-S08-C54 TaxID=743098 RepID=D6PBZ0_9ARCH|nr:hypothetical protein [uncultured archaeon MedDCM-OCT-S08-C54]
MTKSSEAPGFYKKDPSERLDFVKNFANLTEDEMKQLADTELLERKLQIE